MGEACPGRGLPALTLGQSAAPRSGPAVFPLTRPQGADLEAPAAATWVTAVVVPNQRCFSPLRVFVALLWTRSKRSTCFCCWGPQSWLRHSKWGLTRQSRGRQSPSSTCIWPPLCCYRPGCSWPSGLQACTAGSCRAFGPPEPPSPLHRAALNESMSFSPSLCSCVGLPRPRCSTLHLALLNLITMT